MPSGSCLARFSGRIGRQVRAKGQGLRAQLAPGAVKREGAAQGEARTPTAHGHKQHQPGRLAHVALHGQHAARGQPGCGQVANELRQAFGQVHEEQRSAGAKAAARAGGKGGKAARSLEARAVAVQIGAALARAGNAKGRVGQGEVQARRRGARLVCVDPYRSRTAEMADLHIAPFPGTDAARRTALALGDSTSFPEFRPFLPGDDPGIGRFGLRS